MAAGERGLGSQRQKLVLKLWAVYLIQWMSRNRLLYRIKLSDVLNFVALFIVFLRFLCFSIVYLRLEDGFQYLLDIFATSKMLTEYGLSDPFFITTILL